MPAYRRGKQAVAAAVAACLILLTHPGLCAGGSMKGPPVAASRAPAGGRTPETSSIRLVFLGAIGLFQKRISPIEGPRCGFVPSCSAYGHQAIREQGPVRGVMMTAERLMRDTVLTVPGPGYIVLPNGTIFDPVSRNLLLE